MRVKWFGDPWPNALHRAPICESDADRVEIPVGSKCLDCEKAIVERDRGVITACSPNIWGSWELTWNGKIFRVCSYHLSCWLSSVVGEKMSGEILARMNGATEKAVPVSVGEISDEKLAEVMEEWSEGTPGRGWGKV